MRKGYCFYVVLATTLSWIIFNTYYQKWKEQLQDDDDKKTNYDAKFSSQERLLQNTQSTDLSKVNLKPSLLLNNGNSLRTEALKKIKKKSNHSSDRTVHEGSSKSVKMTHLHSSERSLEYCNPREKITGDEGKVNSKYELINVHVLIRHGDRSPMHSFQNLATPPLNCRFYGEDNTSREYFSFMQNLKHRLPPRSMGHILGLYPDSEHCEGSQLTPRGVHQHLKIGELLRKAYVDGHDLLGEKLGNSTPVYVRSTEYTRTYQSGLAFLYGLLGGFKSGLKNVYFEMGTLAINLCSEKYSGFNCNCPAIAILERFIAVESKRHSNEVNETEKMKIKEKVGSILGINATKLPWLASIMDVLSSYICHDQPLPCVANTGKCFTIDLINQIWNYLDNASPKGYIIETNLKSSRLQMQPLLAEIARRYINITTHGLGPRFVLYSGHDKTVTAFAQSLGIAKLKWPPFASRIVLELYKSVNSQNIGEDYFLRILYNGKNITHSLTFCQNSNDASMCSLNNFLDFVFKINFRLKDFGYYNAFKNNLKFKDVVNYNDACMVS